MSRLEFRAAVDSPRPAAAWLMAFVASATLWITGEIAAWVAAVQVVAFIVSFVTRSDPPAWRRSAIWLNVGMFGITSVTISLAIHGSPATLSLAYFAALSQGLQLLDARPRKSEFLLVALSLFQVILAANLTDSVFFPPLLVVFLVTVTWTLLVHTLRTEAAEAGDASAAGRAITPGLLRVTLVASSVSILLALVLFTLLPRMRASMLTGRMGGDLAMAGFSERVELGTIGRIRQDDTVVLRVEDVQGSALSARDAYWRGLAFDHFDGRQWSISGLPPIGATRETLSGIPRFGLDIGAGAQSATRVQRIVREPVDGGVLFAAGSIRRVEGPLQQLQLDVNGGLYFPPEADQRIRYTVWTAPMPLPNALPPEERTRPPRHANARVDRALAERYLDLPPLDPRIRRLAEEITAGATSDLARVRAIEDHLGRHGRYTDDPPDMGAVSEHSPVEGFLLGELAGHCEYFASGMVVLTRSIGIPSRLVNGFAGGRRNRFGGFTELTRSDAHAWVEVHFEHAGWVRFDPTPPDLRLRTQDARSLAAQLAELASVIELWWFQRVVDFDSADQILALKATFSFLRDLRPKSAAEADAAGPGKRGWRLDGNAPWRDLLLFAAAVVLLIQWLQQRRLRGVERSLPTAYARALRLLSRKGLKRRPTTTARGFAQEVARRAPPPAAACFDRLTEAYLRERFGGRRPPPETTARELALLREQLAKMERS